MVETLLLDARTQMELAGVALAAAAVLAVPLGVLAASMRLLRPPILALASLGRTIPSLAVLMFVLPFLGVGFLPAVVALTLLAVPPIAINVDVALRGVPEAPLDAARGIGMTSRQRFLQIAWPLSLPVTLAGVRTAAIEVVASATLATFIGGGGLGDDIVRGLQTGDATLLIAASATVAALAFAVELLLGAAVRGVEARV
ncbi:MAG: ABC transporter permease [Vulcanimicrobiaceae bacterium]